MVSDRRSQARRCKRSGRPGLETSPKKGPPAPASWHAACSSERPPEVAQRSRYAPDGGTPVGPGGPRRQEVAARGSGTSRGQGESMTRLGLFVALLVLPLTALAPGHVSWLAPRAGR